MLSRPEILTTEPITAAAIRLKVPSSEIMTHMGPGITEVYAVLKAQGVAPAGPWLTHHFTAPGAYFDFEICVPVGSDVTPSGRVVMTTIPAARVARATYTGPYEGLGAGWGELMNWIRAEGLTAEDALWEIYARGPETGPDSATYETVLHKPLKP
jgi:effector-binding domain-containing protein